MLLKFRALALACAFVSTLPLLGCGGVGQGSKGDDRRGGGHERRNGAASSGGKGANTGNLVVTQIRTTGVDKVDLLFMIDNSISMADKQRILAKAVPLLVERLTRPVCVNAQGDVTGSQPCAASSVPE